MTGAPEQEPIALHHVLELLHDDQDLFVWLREEGFLPAPPEPYTRDHADIARVAGTLVHELEVNWPGAAVALRLRAELLATRTQMAELIGLLRSTTKTSSR